MDLALLGKSALALGLMGALAGLALSIAARRFHVEVDPKVDAIFGVLPGANCGACGHASCFAVAEAMAEGAVEPAACTAGGQSVIDGVSDILGVEACAVAETLSARHCGGGTNAARAYEYAGVQTCAAAVRLAGSPVICPAGCIGLGDCMRACTFDAIRMDERGLPIVDMCLCTGCAVCVAECPRGTSGLLTMVPGSAPIVVRCSSHDKAKAKRSYCTLSCIACKKCEKECPSDAIHVKDFVAVVDYENCTGCGVCVSICPQTCIDLYGQQDTYDVSAADGRGAEVPGFEPDVPAPPEVEPHRVEAPTEAVGESTDAMDEA